MLPSHALERLIASPRERLTRLSRDRTAPTLPVAGASWQTIVADACLDLTTQPLELEFRDLADPAVLLAPRKLAEAGARVVTGVERMVENLRCIDAFMPSAGRAAALWE